MPYDRGNYVEPGVLERSPAGLSSSAGSYGPFVLLTGAAVNGTSGTQAGIAAPGALLITVATPGVYQNTNTLASPTWTPFGETIVVTVPQTAVADAAAATVGANITASVGTNIAAFTDPPSAAEMALLRTFVNALKTDAALLITMANAQKADAASLRTELNLALAGLRAAGILSP